jgi:hypothetical protein
LANWSPGATRSPLRARRLASAIPRAQLASRARDGRRRAIHACSARATTRPLDAVPSPSLDRRAFLRRSAGAAAMLAGLACDSRGGETAALDHPEILDALGPSATRAIGLRYRELTPSERDAASLRAGIAGSGSWWSGLDGRSHDGLARRVRADFERGRTVTVLGWVLSVTEARQCALYSLRAT